MDSHGVSDRLKPWVKWAVQNLVLGAVVTFVMVATGALSTRHEEGVVAVWLLASVIVAAARWAFSRDGSDKER